jgi:polysaccharide biosynthesis protein PslH
VNILYVVPYAPNKIRIRPYSLLRFLKARGNDVTLLTLWSDDLDRESINSLEQEGIHVIAYPLPMWRSLVNSAWGMLSRDPLQSFYCWQPELARTLKTLTVDQRSGKRFDVVHVEHLRGVRYAEQLRFWQSQIHKEGEKRIPIVWDSVDCIDHLFRQAKNNPQKLTSRLMFLLELPRTGRFEARMARLFDRTLVTSHVDREAFGALLSPNENTVTVLPNGVDLDYFTPGDEQDREPGTLVVSGKMSYHANVSMVTYLMEKIMPFVWAEKPETRLWIVGKDPPQSIRDFAGHHNVTVTGYVADLRPYLQKATIALSPLTYGAGIQNKVLEAMACATPVITTPKAVSALSVHPGQDLLVEEDPAAFAKQILKHLNHPDLARKVGEAGRRYVETCHHWSSVTAQLETVYAEAINQT